MQVDPAASVRLWAIEIDLAGRTVEIPPLPASHWLPILLDGNPLMVLDLVDGPEGDLVDELILAGGVQANELVDALIAAIEQAAGRPFHTALVLAQVARVQWPSISGLLAEKGFRWDEAPLGAALDAVYTIVAKHLKAEQLARFEVLLNTPVVIQGQRRRRVDREQVMEQFESLAGPRPAGVRATGAPSDNARPKTRRSSRTSPQPSR